MKREVIENLNEKDFVASLIMSDKCCQVLIPHIKLTYFECDYSRVIVTWIMEYYEKFKRSPKKDVVSLYRVHCDEIQDESLKDLVYNYLENISNSEIQINNEDYLLDRSRDFLDYQALKSHVEELTACLQTRSMDKARKIQSEYDQISLSETNEVSLLSKDSIDIIKNALAQTEEVLFNLPGHLNKVVGNIHRNDFIAILASAKKGKTWFLLKIALEALMQQLNVTVVSMEMTREEVIQRLWKMLFGSASGLIKPGKYEGTRFVEDLSEKDCYRYEKIDVEVVEKELPSPEKLQEKLRMTNGYLSNLRIISYPAFGASVIGITDRVKELAQKEGFVTDVLVIDYGDITMPIGGGSEVRNQLDAIWKHLRGFSMSFHCATFTASQTNRGGFSASVVDANSIAEDIRKICHVTSMVSMEQTPAMKKDHLMRIRNIALRNGEDADVCIFPQCLSLGQFIFDKPIPESQLIIDEDEDDDENDADDQILILNKGE